MYVHVKIFPHSKKEKIEKREENYFYVYVKEKAEQNKANIRMMEILTEYFHISRKQIYIISGHHKPKKLLEIKNEHGGE